MNKSEYIALKARVKHELHNIDLIEQALTKEGLFPKVVSNKQRNGSSEKAIKNLQDAEKRHLFIFAHHG